MKSILSPHISLESESEALERSYAMGIVHTELPDPLGVSGPNSMYVEKMPTVGKGLTDPRLCIYHQGSIVPYLSSIYLLPDTSTTIVDPTSSMANNSAADRLGQLLLEAVLDNPDKNKYVAIARESANIAVGLWLKMTKELEQHCEPNTLHKHLVKYTALYYNIICDRCIEVYEDEGGLKMCFQPHREEPYRLYHHLYDSFSWLLTRNEDVYRGRFPVVNLDFCALTFYTADDSENVDQLTWKHDRGLPSGETFHKRRPG